MAESRLLEANQRRSGTWVTCKAKERAAVEALVRNLCNSKGRALPCRLDTATAVLRTHGITVTLMLKNEPT